MRSDKIISLLLKKKKEWDYKLDIIHNQLHDIFALSQEEFLIRLWVKKGLAKEVWVVFFDRYQADNQKTVKMELYFETNEYELYKTTIDAKTKRLGYKFILKLFDSSFKIYNQYGLVDEDDKYFGHFHFPYANPSDVFIKPKWTENLVVYEIFPDRFSREDEKEQRLNLWPWDYKEWKEGGSRVFLGGNFKGILKRLDYLKSLGVNAIYLTPLFKSSSSHRYNVDDYFKIDPLLGTNEEFKDLVKTLHENDIKVIVDMVFNHTGIDFFAFKDIIENGEKSQYFDWYNIKSLPIDVKECNYETFATGVHTMPRIDTSKKDVQDFFLGVLKYWLSEFGVDGFRFDVANELDKNFIRRIRMELKAIKDDILLIGEVMHRSEQFLFGDMFDGVMNYFSWEVFSRYLLGKYTAKDVAKILAEYRLKFNPKIFSCQLNLIGSHDTPRVLNVLKKDKSLSMLAAVYNLTYQGIPMIYYGDEVGMEGEHDPDCRRGMIWDTHQWDGELLKLYKRLIALKKTSKALNCDDVKEKVFEDILYFERETEDELIYVIFNPHQTEKKVEIVNPHILSKEVTFFTKEEKYKNYSAKLQVELKQRSFEIIIVR